MIFTVFVYFVVSANAQMSKSDLQKMYMDYLQTEGYVPTLSEKGGLITFKSDGRTYILQINADDLEFFQLQYLFWDIESEQERIKALRVASQVNENTKVAKIYTFGEDSMMCEAGIFIKQPQDFKHYFARLIRTIRFAINSFSEEMNK